MKMRYNSLARAFPRMRVDRERIDQRENRERVVDDQNLERVTRANIKTHGLRIVREHRVTRGRESLRIFSLQALSHSYVKSAGVGSVDVIDI